MYLVDLVLKGKESISILQSFLQHLFCMYICMRHRSKEMTTTNFERLEIRSLRNIKVPMSHQIVSGLWQNQFI